MAKGVASNQSIKSSGSDLRFNNPTLNKIKMESTDFTETFASQKS
jgi:hypothetical protein